MSDAASQRGQCVHGALRGLARCARSGLHGATISTNKTTGDAWHDDVVRPLRNLRSEWRNAALEDAALGGLRATVKALELEAEQSLLTQLEGLSADWPAGEARDAEEWLIGLVDESAEGCVVGNRDALHVLRIAVGHSDDQL